MNQTNVSLLYFRSVCLTLIFVISVHCSTKVDPVSKSANLRLELNAENLPPGIVVSKLGYKVNFFHCPKVSKNSCFDPIFTIVSPQKGIQTTIESTLPNVWTHMSIAITGWEHLRGKFSPGHNPIWIQNEGQSEINFAYTFHFRTQENLIPNAIGEEVAKKFAPILVFHKDKKHLPSNLEKYASYLETKNYPLPDKDIRKRSQKLKLGKYIELPELDDKNNDIHLYYHVRYAKSTVSGTDPLALPGFRDNWNYWYEPGNGDMVVSYWIWYDQNIGPTKFGNIHQGDLESYSLLISKDGNAKRILLTGHDHVLLDTSFENINSLKNHPILYIAKGNMGADGGNPTSAYGGYTVKLDAGNFLFNFISDPRDIFPSFNPNESMIIIPEGINQNDLISVKIGSGKPNETIYVDARQMVKKSIRKLVAWEEPGWIGEPSFQDPDGHHKVDDDIKYIFKFDGRIGKHPRSKLVWSELTQFGESPENAPFKTNIEQHYSFESPRFDRTHSDREGNYGPKFLGDANTPQR
ncbi:hypothetical protein P3G55_07905 [Leptospira sp. 96542]|nr:hypothetical protein [Leptospira sp. 96542]